MLARGGGTKQTELAVAGALNWLARHQSSDGSWSIDNFFCPEKNCGGVGTIHNANAAGTALGLLPFLAAGQTHQSKGPYKTHITKAVNWLVEPSGSQRRSLGRRPANVLARPGGHRALRGLRHDQRFAHPPCRAGSRAVHSRLAKRAGRVAVQSRLEGFRHLGLRLADDGAEKSR